MEKKRMATGALIAGAIALATITQWEGTRTEAYLDPVGIPTIGIGSTMYEDGSKVQIGDVITKEEARKLFTTTVDNIYAKAVQRCVKVPLAQHEFDSLVSLTYNIGPTNFCSSTLVKKANIKDYVGMCKELNRWVYSKGKKLAGLVKRRAQETKLCLGI